MAGERVFGGGFMIAGAVLLLVFANVVATRFDRATGRMTKSVRGIIRRSQISHALDDITGVEVVQGTSSGNAPSPRYRLVVTLKGAGRVPINSGSGGAKADKERLAAEIRRFLNLPDAPEHDPPGFADFLNAMRGPR